MLPYRKTLALLAASFVLFAFSGAAFATENEALAIENEDAVVEEDSYTSDVWERIRKGFRMPTLTGRRVTTQLRIHERMPQYIERMAQRSSKYLYHIVEEVETRNLPTELALLPFVESAFQPEALSYAKASGLWQFTAATGNVYSCLLYTSPSPRD